MRFDVHKTVRTYVGHAHAPHVHTDTQVSPGRRFRLGLGRVEGRESVALVFTLFKGSLEVISPFLWWSEGCGIIRSLRSISGHTRKRGPFRRSTPSNEYPVRYTDVLRLRQSVLATILIRGWIWWVPGWVSSSARSGS